MSNKAIEFLDPVKIKETFQERYSGMKFRKRLFDEIVDAVQTLPKRVAKNYKKFFSGMGLSWVFNDREDAIAENKKFTRQYAVMVIAHTGLSLFAAIFLRSRRAWPAVVIHEIDPMNPLFLPPVNRTKGFTNAVPERSRLGKELVIHLPTCSSCHEKLLWGIIQTSSERDRYVYYDDRELYCANKRCSVYRHRTGQLVADIELSNEKDTKAFAKLFLDARARRKKYYDKNSNDLPRPARWTRYWTKLGYTFPREQNPYANDTAVEKQLDQSRQSPYSDLQYENLNPYPNG